MKPWISQTLIVRRPVWKWTSRFFPSTRWQRLRGTPESRSTRCRSGGRVDVPAYSVQCSSPRRPEHRKIRRMPQSWYGTPTTAIMGRTELSPRLRVADIFMGGGTTIVEGSRLGMKMYGTDLNPVAWLVVKNALAEVDYSEIDTMLAEIEAEVRPQIIPFYACDCPRGHKGVWRRISTSEVMGNEFDPLAPFSRGTPRLCLPWSGDNL